MPQVKSYEVKSVMEHAQYFTGGGIAFTKWEDYAVGVGSTEKEAFDDAVNQLGEMGWTHLPEGNEGMGMSDEVDPDIANQEEDGELAVYVTIRVSSKNVNDPPGVTVRNVFVPL